MKKILTLLMLSMSICLLSSCEYLKSYTQQDAATCGVDSAQVVEIVNQIIQPEFTTVDELMDFRAGKFENLKNEEILLSLPDETVEQIATVSIKTLGYVSLESLAMEYTAHQDVYDNLPVKDKDDSDTNDEEVIPIIQEQFVDTVIDGKHVHLKRLIQK